MRILIMLISILLFAVLSINSSAEDKAHRMDEGSQHKMHSVEDGRISLGLSPAMKQHQLANMRSHVEAVQSIIGLLSEGAFDKASHIAYSKLGLTEEMKKMCNSFENETFKNLGLAFHKSGDALGNTLKTKDLTKSLGALNTTMTYCVQCHATFRQ
ncbi:MAG: cytochrome C [Nitrospina sp.]|jgi:hypothetical protein|nr:cytochrome C [Nitrospina sp.]MBT5633406.1 cytochrome C [Nitrospina sp.]